MLAVHSHGKISLHASANVLLACLVDTSQAVAHGFAMTNAAQLITTSFTAGTPGRLAGCAPTSWQIGWTRTYKPREKLTKKTGSNNTGASYRLNEACLCSPVGAAAQCAPDAAYACLVALPGAELCAPAVRHCAAAPSGLPEDLQLAAA